MTRSVEDALVVRMEATLAQFERKMAKGERVAVKAATGSEKAWKKAGSQIAANSNRAASGLQRMTNVSRGGRFVIQNTANQIGDMAVQMEMGTDASRIMTQQLPQLFGGFTALGGALGLLGPLLGTAFALGVPLATTLFNVGEGAESSEDRIKGLNAALDEYRASADRAAQSSADLSRTYGADAKKARRLMELQREIARIRYQRQFSLAANSMADQVGGNVAGGRDEIQRVGRLIEAHKQLFAARKQEFDLLEELGRQRTEADTQRMRELRGLMGQSIGAALDNAELVGKLQEIEERFNISTQAAAELLATLSDIQSAPGPAEQALAFRQLSELIFDATNGLKDADDEAQLLYQEILNVAEAGMEFEKVDFATPLDEGTESASRFANELARAVGFKNALDRQGGADGLAEQYAQYGAGRWQREQLLRDNDPLYGGNGNVLSGLGYYDRKARKGGGSPEQGLKEAQNLYSKTRTEAERYAAEVDRINELHRKFPEIITSEVRDRALDALKEASTEIGRMADRLGKGFEDAFANFVVGAGNARDAGRALLADLARMAARSAISKLGLGGLISGALGGVFGAAPSHASGTNFHGGGPARINEFGAENVILPTGTKVVPAYRSNGVGSGYMYVRVFVDDTGSWQAAVEGIAGPGAARVLQHG
ncbi:hypothetical protein, partial [Shimia sp.]|uniref:hypothetical protein n=1 Tax=Shimia sp. TaxID=1954381 RepID=UPI003B8AD3E6